MKRRSFFKSLATLVATVALAPEIAFNRPIKPELPNKWAAVPFWHQESRWNAHYSNDYLIAMEKIMAGRFWQVENCGA